MPKTTKTKPQPGPPDPVVAMRRWGDRKDPAKFEADSLERQIVESENAVREVTESYERDLARLKKSGHYSREGLAALAAERARTPLARAQKAESDVRDHFRPRLEDLRRSLTVVRKPGADVVAELRAAEIRRVLAALGPDVVLGHLQKAVAESNAEVYEAITSAPLVYENFSLPGELLELAQRTWEERRNPTLTKRVREVEVLLKSLEDAISTGRSVLAELSGQPPESDPTLRAMLEGRLPE